jgi:hypothetical protein
MTENSTIELIRELESLKSELFQAKNQIVTDLSAGVLQEFPAAAELRLTHRKPFLPHSGGCYFVLNKSGEVVYIGSSGNLYKRLGLNQSKEMGKLHHLNLDKILIAPIEWGGFYVEQLLINELSPIGNQTVSLWWGGEFMWQGSKIYRPISSFAFWLRGWHLWSLYCKTKISQDVIRGYFFGFRLPKDEKLAEIADCAGFSLEQAKALFYYRPDTTPT